MKRKKKEEGREKRKWAKKRHYRRKTRKNVGEKFLRLSEGLGDLEEKLTEKLTEKREV